MLRLLLLLRVINGKFTPKIGLLGWENLNLLFRKLFLISLYIYFFLPLLRALRVNNFHLPFPYCSYIESNILDDVTSSNFRAQDQVRPNWTSFYRFRQLKEQFFSIAPKANKYQFEFNVSVCLACAQKMIFLFTSEQPRHFKCGSRKME